MRYGKSHLVLAWLLLGLITMFLPPSLMAYNTPSQVRTTAWGDIVYSKNNTLYRFSQDNQPPLIFSDNHLQINDFYIRGEHIILASQQGLLSHFNQQTTTLYNEPVNRIIRTSFGLYFSAAHGIFKLAGDDVYPELTTPSQIEHFFPVNANRFWLASDNALTLWDTEHQQAIETISIGAPPTQIYFTNNNQLWVLINHKLYIQSGDALVPFSEQLAHLSIYKFSVVDNLLLLQTNKGFLRYALNQNDFIAAADNTVADFYSLDNAQTFIVTQNGAFNVANHSGLARERFFQAHPVIKYFDDMGLATPIQIEQQNDGSYLALNENGLWRFDTHKNAVQNLFEHSFLRGFYLHNKSVIWFYDHHRIFRFSLDQQKILEQISQPNISALVGDGYHEPFVIRANQNTKTRDKERLEVLTPNEDVGAISFAKQINNAVYIGSQLGIWRYEIDAGAFVKITSLPAIAAEVLNNHSLLISTQVGNYILDTQFKKLAYINSFTNDNALLIKQPDGAIIQLGDTYLRFSGLFSFSALSWQTLQEQHLLGEEALLYKTAPLLYHVSATPANAIKLELKSQHSQLWQPVTSQMHIAIYNSLDEYTHIRNSYGLHQQQLALPTNTQVTSNTTQQIMLFALVLVSVLLGVLLFNRHLKHAVTKSLLSLTEEAVWVADSNLQVIEINDKFTQITGLNKQQVVGKKLKIYSHFKRNKKLELQITMALKQKGYWKGEFASTNKQGDTSFFAQSIERINHPWLPFAQHRYLGLVSDITAQRQQEIALKDLATRDQNTGLINRTMLVESIMQASQSANDDLPEFCLLLINIDNFYKINEELGHSQGNFLLRLVADRLKQSLPSAYILSCLGGNDFAILVPPFQYKRATLFGINKLCQELQQHLQSTFHILNTPISLTACIGIAVYPDNGYDSESLIASAESALHYAKELGPNNYQFYKRTIKKRIKSSLSIENEIVQAIENNDFILYYQPKFNLNSQQVEGAEALVRWPDEQGNIRPPSYFIDICEQNNSIVPLTKNLLEIACKQLVTWREQGISLNGPLALNMSAVHFQNSELVQELSVLLAKYQLDPSLLELEITETVMMKSPEFAQKQMEQIKSLGIKIALDDFGVGHSSLNYLKHFPIDKLKIDRSFICDIEHSTQGLNITATIIRLAKYLGLDVVAEGVENQQQAYLLNGMGCPVIQGFYYSKPIPASQLESLLMQQKKMLKSRD